MTFCHSDNQYEFCSQSLTSVLLCLGKTLCNIEQFGQYPLQVNGFNNLDECLEGAMVEKEIESLHSDHSVTSGREVKNFINWLAITLLCMYVCFAKTVMFSLVCRDGSKSYHQSWHLNCLDLNSTPSSVVLKRYTRNWSSHKSFIWTGERCTDNNNHRWASSFSFTISNRVK